jgi:thermitase
MTVDKPGSGHPFRGDYPGFYEVPPRLRDVLRRQRAELTRLRTDPTRRAAITGVLQGRRSGRPDLAQLELVPGKNGREAFVAQGELLLPRDWYAAPEVRELLRSAGLAERPGSHEDRPDRFVRLRHPGMSSAAVERVVGDLARQGRNAQPNHVLTLAAVGKGIGGPEPIAGLGAFSAYPVSVPSGPPTRVAIIDTGIPLDPHGDGWLAGVQRCAANLDPLDNLPGGPDGFLDFQAGHGTFVAGIVQQVAPGAEIRVYRAADTDGFATDADVAAAMLRAADQGAQVINLSLGGTTVDGTPPPALADAVAAIGDQVVIVAAAGNDGDDTPCWPAALPGVEAVAGLTADLSGAQWSSRGSWVRFATIGEGIRSVFVAGQESPVFDPEPDTFPGDAWAVWTGTSFAAPQVTGAIARISQEQGLSAREAVDLLDRLGVPVPGFGSAMQILPGLV